MPPPMMDPPSGRLAVENNLRQPVVIDRFPNEHAGAPVDGYEDDHTERSHYAQSIDPHNHSTYAPFKSRLDWEIARWAKLRGPSSTAISFFALKCLLRALHRTQMRRRVMAYVRVCNTLQEHCADP